MKKILCICAWLCYCFDSYAQTDTTAKNMDEIIIYSGKFAERRKNIAQKIEVISARQIAQWNAQNTGDLLINTGNVFVQKSQQGGSSPVIRGFEASRVLLVVDGIRLNNAIYRAGHLQNVITVDQNSLEGIEVIYGPGSTLYGSDALGGVVLMRTKKPKLSLGNELLATGSAFIRYSSANQEKTAHTDISIGGRKFAWLQAFNYSDFGDMKMGDNYSDKYPNFGRRSQFITRINGVDSVVANPDDRVQKFSGYRQWDLTQKFLYRQSSRVSHSLNLQHSNSTNVPRYDRLQDIRNGALRYAEWFYGPQTRYLGAYELNAANDLGFLNALRLNVNYQKIEESRHQREYRRYDRLDSRYEKLGVWGFVADARKVWTNNELTFGIDGQLNDVTSKGIRKNIQSSAETKLDSRYPNGKNNMNYFGLYAQHLLKLKGGKFIINDGVRLQTVSLTSTIADNSFFNFPFTEINQENFAVTGNLGAVYLPSENTRVNLSLSSGFRAPNVDDVARIFESNTASRQLIVPNPAIGPEYTYNVDLGFTQHIKNIRFEVTGFYTWFRNAISLSPYRFGGEDSITYNGTRVKVFANQNVNKAYVYGVNSNLTVDFGKGFRFYSTINYTYGRLQPNGATEVPLDHIPPVYGKNSLSYTQRFVTAEFYSIYNGWKKIADYNPSGEDNAQYATLDGTPSWYTLNLKTTFTPQKNISIQLGVENILDRNYRYFASGFSAPGRNFILALRSNF